MSKQQGGKSRIVWKVLSELSRHPSWDSHWEREDVSKVIVSPIISNLEDIGVILSGVGKQAAQQP